MIAVTAWSAVHDRELPGLSHTNLQVLPQPEARKTTSPAAAYALQAARALNIPHGAGLFTISGATGMTCEVFDGAWRRSADGHLSGAGFAEGRYKRIHPLTLITSLQNQVPAVLSMELGLTGPCLNCLESAQALVHGQANLEAMVRSQGAALIVLATAPDRGEERLKHALAHPEVPLLEGALCLLAQETGHGVPLDTLMTWLAGTEALAQALDRLVRQLQLRRP